MLQFRTRNENISFEDTTALGSVCFCFPLLFRFPFFKKKKFHSSADQIECRQLLCGRTYVWKNEAQCLVNDKSLKFNWFNFQGFSNFIQTFPRQFKQIFVYISTARISAILFYVHIFQGFQSFPHSTNIMRFLVTGGLSLIFINS